MGDDRRRVVGRQRSREPNPRMPVHEERAGVDHQHAAHLRACVEHLERVVEVLLILDDDQRRAAVLEKVAHLAGSARRVDAVGDRAEGPAPPDRRSSTPGHGLPTMATVSPRLSRYSRANSAPGRRRDRRACATSSPARCRAPSSGTRRVRAASARARRASPESGSRATPRNSCRADSTGRDYPGPLMTAWSR